MPYGTVNADVIGTSVANSNLGAGNATVFKSRIINGDMRIDQRNAGASITQSTSVQYIVDRFALYGSVASKCTGQQNAGSVTPPAGFKNYIGVTSSSAYTVGTSEQFLIWQRIEGNNIADLGWGTANAKAITLSFWVYSSLTGTFGGVVKNSASSYAYPFTYSIASANTWQQITLSIAGPTTGTWLTDTGIGINVYWGLGVGSTLSGTAGAWASGDYSSATGATSVVGTNGATFYITGVQLEVGSSATGFEYRDYTTQLAMCYRYFYSIPKLVAYQNIAPAICYASTDSYIPFTYPVTMRTAPTLLISSASDFTLTGNGGTATPSVIAAAQISNISMQVEVTATASQGYAYWLRHLSGGTIPDYTKYFAVSAEL